MEPLQSPEALQKSSASGAHQDEYARYAEETSDSSPLVASISCRYNDKTHEGERVSGRAKIERPPSESESALLHVPHRRRTVAARIYTYARGFNISAHSFVGGSRTAACLQL